MIIFCFALQLNHCSLKETVLSIDQYEGRQWILMNVVGKNNLSV